MNHIRPPSVIIKNLIIEDSFINFYNFTTSIGHATLKEAAIIPLSEYLELLHIAEKYEQLAGLQPLADHITVKDYLESAYIKENLNLEIEE